MFKNIWKQSVGLKCNISEMYTNTHTHINTYTQKHTQSHTHTHAHTHAHIHTHMHTQTHTHTINHTHTYTHSDQGVGSGVAIFMQNERVRKLQLKLNAKCSNNQAEQLTYLLTPWSRVLLEKLTVCS
jgi:ABC-type Zn2+ transport system substrate-binding protein/surface adhesin